MSLAAAFDVKGWCPGALRPMASGDGLIARIRPWCSAFTLAQARGLADIATCLGNGHIDLTRRANLQIRGLSAERLPELHDALDRLSLLDPDAGTEAARNVMVGPLANADVRALADSLSRALAADRRVGDLPAKFAWLVDSGGPLSIIGERAGIALYVTDAGVALRVHDEWLGGASIESALEAALGEKPNLPKIDIVPSPGRRRLGNLGGMSGVAAPFGRLEAGQLRELTALAAAAGASEIRLSPWRALYVDALIDGAAGLGLIVDEGDPLLRIDACPGAPACRSASVDTRRDARRLASLGFEGTLHVSGCAKGCARSAIADLTLVGEAGRYGVVRHGTTRDRIERTIAAVDVATVLHD
jgi:precorrin-3B synthase